MSLLRLLTAGRSLVSVRDTESRYRLTTQRLLPQFAPARNPFASKREAESSPAPASQQDAGARSVPPKTGVWSSAPEVWRRMAMLWSGWKRKASELIARPRRATAKPAMPHLGKPPVQGELSLDRVKVMRNDLSQADVEVVPARPKGTPGPSAAEPGAGAESAWGVTPRFLQACKR